MKPVRRFVALLEGHGIARTQIPRFLKDFGVSLSLVDITTDEALLHKMDETLLDKVCDIFGVRREWLDGVDERIYPRIWFYGNLHRFIDLMGELYEQSDDIDLIAIKSPENKLDKDLHEHEFAIALVIKVKIGCLGETPIYKHRCLHNFIVVNFFKKPLFSQGILTQKYVVTY
jgi:hypothetical protein